MTMYNHNFNKVVTQIAAAITDVVSLLEQINTSPDTLYAVIDLVNVLLLLLLLFSLLIKITRSFMLST